MTILNYDREYIQYAQQVINGNIIAGEYIKLACKRFIDWFNRDDIFFNYDDVDRRIRFIERLKATNGQQFKLMNWQKFAIAGIFGWHYTNDREQRVINNVLLMISRKNGKTAFASAIALSCMLLDKEPSQEVYMIANSAAQAGIAMKHAKSQVKSIDIQGKLFRILRNIIELPKKDSIVKILSSDTSKLDGLSPSVFIADEIHEMKTWENWNILKTGQGNRKNALAIGITTSGFNIGDQYPCYNMWTNCIELLRGIKSDDTWFSMIFQMDEGDDWKDEKSWIKACPSLGQTISYKYMKEQIQSAINNNSLEVSIRTKNLNQWMQTSNIWIKDEVLMRLFKQVDLSKLQYESTFMGVDLSSVGDLTCWSIMIPPNNLREYYPDKYLFKTFVYIPQEALNTSANKEYYKEWVRNGHAIMTSGNVVDYDYILKDQKKVTEQLTLMEVAYDAYNATSWAIDATNEGLPLKPYSQSLINFNIPTKSFERLVLSDKLIIDINPVILWMFRNVELKFDHAENCKPFKANGDKNNKIDGVISMLESLGSFLHSNSFDPKIFLI